MAIVDPVVEAMTKIRNAENASLKECTLKPASKFIGEVLRIAKENDYITSYVMNDDHGVISFHVVLNGKINTCKGIRPRFAVRKDEFDRYEKRYLPARDVGLIIVSTPQGLMTHHEAKAKKIGGRLVAFMY